MRDPTEGVEKPEQFKELQEVKHNASLFVNDKQASNNYLKCIKCANSNYLNVFTNQCLPCDSLCMDCAFFAPENKSNCTRCELSYRLTAAGRRCVEPNLEIIGDMFLRSLIFLFFLGGFIMVCCPSIFEKMSKNAKKNSIENLVIYKKLKGNDQINV